MKRLKKRLEKEEVKKRIPTDNSSDDILKD